MSFYGGLHVPTSKQISVFLENKPGRLANVLLTLARERVNITALTVMDSHEHSVLRFVADDLDKTRKTLKDMGTPFAETEVLLVELKNQPGELAHVCELLGAEHINIEYAYCSSGGRNGRTVGILKVGNPAKASKVLNGVNGASKRKASARPPRDRRAYQAARAARE